MKRVVVNSEQCALIAKVLQGLQIRQSVFEREFITFSSSSETKLRAYLYVVGICQQTHLLANTRLNLYGFNYLEKVFVDLAKADSEFLNPLFLAKQSISELSERLALLFSAAGDGKECTLDRLSERSNQLIDMGRKLLDHFSAHVTKLFEMSSGCLSGDKGIYAQLQHFEAYCDPMKKKSSLFIKFAMEAGLVSINDIQNLKPIIDYHVQRVLLRFGCVEIVDRQLKQALINREKLNSDVEIRTASLQALQLLAQNSGHTCMAVHDFLWPLGRSCCLEKPLCKSHSCDKSPCTFHLFVNLPSHDSCLFEKSCKAAAHDEYRNLWQPIVETHYY